MEVFPEVLARGLQIDQQRDIGTKRFPIGKRKLDAKNAKDAKRAK